VWLNITKKFSRQNATSFLTFRTQGVVNPPPSFVESKKYRGVKLWVLLYFARSATGHPFQTLQHKRKKREAYCLEFFATLQ
jgi:hypothetical protein